MSLRPPIVRTLLVSGALLLLAARASAAEGASSGASEFFKWINFAILVALLLWAGFRKMGPALAASREAVGAAIREAGAAKARADEQLRQANERLARLEEEVRAIREEAARAAASETERIRALARSDAEKIAAAAQAEIAAAERAARLELKALGARLAVDGAETLLGTRLTRERQDALVAGFVASLAGRAN